MAVEAADSDVATPGTVGGALRDTWTSLRSVFVNPALRRIELAGEPAEMQTLFVGGLKRLPISYEIA